MFFTIRPIKKIFLFFIMCLGKNWGGRAGGFFFYFLYPVFGGIDSSGSIDYLQMCYTLFFIGSYTVACWKSNCRRSGTSLVFLKD